MEKIAVFPGSFDPFTVGHESIVLRGLNLFDRVIVAIGHNTTKNSCFSVEQRIRMVQEIFAGTPQVEVVTFEGLTVDFCKSINAKFILRGLRTSADFEYERAIGQMNKMMDDDIETVFLLTSTIHTPINSSIVREIMKNKGDVSAFIPKSLDIKKYLEE
ncbi:pantetheine-phosphate adenylyltransferase [Acetobacteroides hydrogenigenes]|uniref:Phosphopantetheine adenylyltransferase n=1 Tax=Acetobacteroides hydrogenigenes TaxID=979970 RepID=A0A4R2EVS4_9BACT|nr:pantetheine-phosphate adenylyltransferase [Acetobacteroides hydrogenigenes]TCN73132.1 phosphopantetheine adenylyltransferase [Acetobacteroides hydrogenigenes]